MTPTRIVCDTASLTVRADEYEVSRADREAFERRMATTLREHDRSMAALRSGRPTRHPFVIESGKVH